MTFKVESTRFHWAWTTIGAIACFAVLAWLDIKLKEQSGFGTVDLQSAQDGHDVRVIATAWVLRGGAATAGFNLGFDYLFMPLYGFAFYFSGLLVRNAYAPKPGTVRRVLSIVAVVPLAGAIFDAIENGLEFWMVRSGATDAMAGYAYAATQVKLLCFYVGLVLLIGAFATLFTERKKKPAVTSPAH